LAYSDADGAIGVLDAVGFVLRDGRWILLRKAEETFTKDDFAYPLWIIDPDQYEQDKNDHRRSREFVGKHPNGESNRVKVPETMEIPEDSIINQIIGFKALPGFDLDKYIETHGGAGGGRIHRYCFSQVYSPPNPGTFHRNAGNRPGRKNKDKMLNQRENLWTIEYVAEYCQVKASVVKNWIYKFGLPFMKLGKHVSALPPKKWTGS